MSQSVASLLFLVAWMFLYSRQITCARAILLGRGKILGGILLVLVFYFCMDAYQTVAWEGHENTWKFVVNFGTLKKNFPLGLVTGPTRFPHQLSLHVGKTILWINMFSFYSFITPSLLRLFAAFVRGFRAVLWFARPIFHLLFIKFHSFAPLSLLVPYSAIRLFVRSILVCGHLSTYPSLGANRGPTQILWPRFKAGLDEKGTTTDPVSGSASIHRRVCFLKPLRNTDD